MHQRSRSAKFIIVMSLAMVVVVPSAAFAADNKPDNFKVRDVFAKKRILVTDGSTDTYLELEGDCAFTSKDIRKNTSIEASRPYAVRYKNEKYPITGDRVLHKGKVCTVKRYDVSPNFLALKVRSRTNDTITVTTASKAKYTLRVNSRCNTSDFPIEKKAYVFSYDYYPGTIDTLYSFRPKSKTYSFRNVRCSITETTIDRLGSNTRYKPRVTVAKARLAKKKRPKRNNRNYITLINRSRRVITTNGWTVENSQGVRRFLPVVELKINQKLRVHSGKGRTRQVTPLMKYGYLGMKKAMFRKKSERFVVRDRTGRVMAVYYRQFHKQ